jgi:REP element-mobilizing transposase RayT
MQGKSVFSHVVFTLKNSRYDFIKVRRKKPVGFIASTYPFVEGPAEEILIEELCNIANEIGLQIIALNFCGDHLHVVIKSKSASLSKLMMLWKGKTSYNFNRRLNPQVDEQPAIDSQGTKQGLWAKSYYQQLIKTEEELKSTIYYISNNRKKHGLSPLSPGSLEIIDNIIKSSLTL